MVPICNRQLLDVRKEDLLYGGLYRACNTYRGGGGYDQFNEIFFKRFGWRPNPTQFVVQLYGCVLNCPYCYVTKDGVFGTPVPTTTADLMAAYVLTRFDVFHLMGGAPAIYLNKWKEFFTWHRPITIFHSDFLLVEGLYNKEDLIDLPGLHAVSIKQYNLYTAAQRELMWVNLKTLIDCNVNFYITFTGVDEFSKEITSKFGAEVLEDSFVIDIKDYKATEDK